MELNDLKIFIELYNNRSISKTAEKLNYTQSNISTRLMKLEQEFNTQLFIRTKSGLQILPDTERFYFRAKKVVDSLQDLYQEFSLTSQQLNVGSTQLLSRLFFPGLYLQNNMLSLHTTSSNKLCRHFSNHIFDIILTHTKLESSSNAIRFEKSENLLWASSANFTKEDSKIVNIVINRDKLCPLRKLSIEATHSLNSNFALVEVDTLDLMLSLVNTSNCIALLPQKLIENDMGLIPYDLLPPRILEIFLYSYQDIDMKILIDCFIQPFSFNKSL